MPHDYKRALGLHRDHPMSTGGDGFYITESETEPAEAVA